MWSWMWGWYNIIVDWLNGCVDAEDANASKAPPAKADPPASKASPPVEVKKVEAKNRILEDVASPADDPIALLTGFCKDLPWYTRWWNTIKGWFGSKANCISLHNLKQDP